jgi:hypothetical protein
MVNFFFSITLCFPFICQWKINATKLANNFEIVCVCGFEMLLLLIINVLLCLLSPLFYFFGVIQESNFGLICFSGSIATMDIHVEMKFGSSYFLQNFLFGFIAVIYMTTIEVNFCFLKFQYVVLWLSPK